MATDFDCFDDCYSENIEDGMDHDEAMDSALFEWGNDDDDD